VNPQIIKSYAMGDRYGMHLLVCRGAKFSCLAMLLMALPIICETERILVVWLTVVPEHTVVFVRLSLVLGLLDSIGLSGYTACAATGNMRQYALILTPIGLLEFPLTWVFFAYGAPVVSTYYLYILVKTMVLVARMFLMNGMIGLRMGMYFSQVFRPILLTIALAVIPPFFVIRLMDPSLVRLFVSVIVGGLSVVLASFLVGMTGGERKVVVNRFFRLVNHYK
jgi:hypothetical protein